MKQTEKVLYSDFNKHIFTESKIVPGLQVMINEVLTCPKCSAIHSGIEHGETTTCNCCGLTMTRWGNVLSMSFWIVK